MYDTDENSKIPLKRATKQSVECGEHRVTPCRLGSQGECPLPGRREAQVPAASLPRCSHLLFALPSGVLLLPKSENAACPIQKQQADRWRGSCPVTLLSSALLSGR